MTGHVALDPGLDFTSSLFLGLHHGSASLPPWASLTTGVPAVLHEAPAAHRVAAAVAAAHGAQAGVVGRSTLHALMDVMGMLPHRGDIVAIDAAAYSLAGWAALRAAANGALVRRYAHHRPESIVPEPGRRLFVMTDGWCQGCNRPAPLPELQRLARDTGGVLIVDDSLAFGVLGSRRPGDVFGDGSGTPNWCGLDHQATVWVASLAKACGAPLAVTTGDHSTIRRLAGQGGNRVHSSPPSAADLAAASRALRDSNENRTRRARLQGHVLRLRNRLRDLGLTVNGMPFPVVSTWLPGSDAQRWWSQLRSAGIRAVLQQSRCRRGVMLTFLVRADHTPADLDRLTVALRAIAVRRGAA
ncbi:aminotransferase class I/II-fold pyridoxal phosphate-dependent enzyme [Kribbella sp. NPDC049174]|uniref:aminotransferase class I/II-fold pyridoxal phosphate-dependent enzyme n=1 Tax=Kribbella sp. NPDC049174 TaxID=3364112 RepID=UPI003715DC22